LRKPTLTKFKKYFISRGIKGFDQEELMEFFDTIKYSMSRESAITMLKFIELAFTRKCALNLVVADKSLKDGKQRKHFNILHLVPSETGIFLSTEVKYEYLGFTFTHNNMKKIYELTEPDTNSKTFQEISSLLSGQQKPTNFQKLLNKQNKKELKKKKGSNNKDKIEQERLEQQRIEKERIEKEERLKFYDYCNKYHLDGEKIEKEMKDFFLNETYGYQDIIFRYFDFHINATSLAEIGFNNKLSGIQLLPHDSPYNFACSFFMYQLSGGFSEDRGAWEQMKKKLDTQNSGVQYSCLKFNEKRIESLVNKWEKKIFAIRKKWKN